MDHGVIFNPCRAAGLRTRKAGATNAATVTRSMPPQSAAKESETMKPTWILVADGSRARLFEQERPDGRMTQRQAWVHPQTRLRAESLALGDLGRASKGHAGMVSFSPRTSLKDREHQRFAHELVQVLDEGVRAGRCAALVLIASNSMLGLIRQDLPTQAAKRVLWSAPVDLTRLDGRELEARIEDLRPPAGPAVPTEVMTDVAERQASAGGPGIPPA
jgi:protein required for attachment to host cells